MSIKALRGQTIELTIEDLALTGKSVGRHDGLVVMVDGGLPGERIECVIFDVKRRFASARFRRVLSPSPERIEPRCRHFSICGGCTWQNLNYDRQVYYKGRFVTEALARIGKVCNVVIDPPVPSGETFYYRNKMEFSFGHRDGRPAGGMHVRGRFDEVFDLDECFLMSEASIEALRLVRRRALELKVPFMNERSGVGELRFLVAREGKLTNELMLNVVTFNREFAGRDELFRTIIDAVPRLTSLFHTVNGKKAHVAIGEEVIPVWGATHLTERIGDLTFQVTPFSFFQTNSRQTKILYDVIVQHAAPQSGHEVLDLFCGCGTISLYLARHVGHVHGIEINAEAVSMAQRNAEFNGITNATFVAGDVRRMLVDLAAAPGRFDTIITDPPRAGMEQKAITRIARLQPKRIVAVSCNPATLARDLELFAREGYRCTRVTPVDMFPQTAHVEAVATLIPDAGAAQMVV